MKAAWPWVRDFVGLAWLVACIGFILFFATWVPA